MSEAKQLENTCAPPLIGADPQGFFDNAPIGIFSSTPEGRYLFANRAFASMCGFDSPEELIASITDISRQVYADPADREPFLRMLEAHGEVINHECRLRRRDGTEFWASRNVRVVKDEKGRIIAHQGFSLDITERKLTEAAQRESDQESRNISAMLRLMCDNVPDMIWAKDLDKKYIFANKAICRNLLNADDTEEPIGKTDMFFAERERNRYPDNPEWHSFGEICRDTDQMTLDANAPKQFDEFGNVQGKFLFLDVHKAPLFDESGKIIGTVGSGRDVTERKRMDQALRESEAKFRQLVENINEIIYSLTSEGLFTFVSPAWTRILGHTAAEVMGHPFSEFVHPDDLPHCYVFLQKVMNIGERQEGVEYRVQHKNGEWRWHTTSANPVKDASGKVVGYDGLARDITKQKRMEEELKVNEANLQAFFASIQDIVVVCQPEGQVLFANDAIVQKLGYSQEELYAIGMLGVLPQDRRLEAEEIFDAMFRGERNSCQLPLQRKDGKLMPVETRVSFGKWNGMDCVFGISKDLTAEQEAQQRFEHLFRNNPALMALSSLPDRCFVDVNNVFLDTLGYSRAEVLGKNSTELCLFPDSEQQKEVADRLATKGSFADFELKVRTKDGSLRDGLFSGDVVVSQDRQYLLTVMIDITERKRAEADLLRSELQLRTLRDSIPDLVWLKNTEGVYLSCNPTFERFFGCKEEQILGKSDYDFFDATLADFFRDNDRKAVEAGGPRMNEEWLTFAQDNYYGLFETIKTPMRDEKGAVIGVLGIARDITERTKQADELKSFFSVTPDLLCIADLEGNFVKNNEAWSRILGYSPEELNTKKFLDFIHPDDIPATFDVMNILGQGEDVLSFINRYRCQDGSYRQLEWRAHPNGMLLYAAARDVTQRLRMEKALKESEERLRLANKATNDVIWDWDVIHDLQQWNEAGTTVFGWTDIVAHPVDAHWWVERVHPDDRQRVHDSFFEVVNNPRLDVWHDEYCFQKADGAYADVLDRGYVLRNEQGKAIRMIGTMLDITERKRAEEALRESEQRFKALHNASFGGIAIHDKGVILDCNLGLSEMSGYTHEELVGMDGLLLIAESSRSEVLRNILDGRENPYNAFGVRKNGEEYPLRLEARNIPYKGQRVRTVEFRDITEQKQAQEAILQAKQEFEGIFENSQVGIMLLKGGRVIARGNQRLADILGYASPEEMSGLSVRELHIDEAKYLEFGERYYHTLSQGDQSQVEYQIKKKDGTPVWAIISGKALDPKDLSKGVIWVMDDLTRRKALETQLINAKDEAEAANSAKSEFLANMSHEIRTPLNGIMGMLQLIRGTNLDQEQSEYAELAIQSSQRLTRLLSDILDLSRIEARKLPLHVEPFSVQEVLQSVEILFLPAARQAGVEFHCNMSPSVPPLLLGDMNRLQQVLNNLVGNAFKFTKVGSILVDACLLPTTKPSSQHVLFAVSDTGCGIPEETLKQIFEPFIQVSTGLTKTHQGAGLGLSICRQLVDLMGGTIAIESTVGQGTTFYFSLAFGLPESHDLVQQQARQVEAAPPHRLSILLVEDDRVSSIAARHLMEKAGYKVTAVEDGRQALDALRREFFDAVLMDVQMAVMDGVKATRAIRNGETGEAMKSIPIIAMTAYSMTADREKFLAAGMDGYVAKPVMMEELTRVIETTLRSRSLNA